MEEQNYDSMLQTLLSQPRSDAYYFYNVGTVYAHLRQWGPSVAYLSKARAMLIVDADVLQNLKFAQAELRQTIGAEKLDPSSSTLELIRDSLTLDGLRLAIGSSALIALCLLFTSYAKTRRALPALRAPTSFLGLVFLAVAASFAFIKVWTDFSPPAISLENMIARSGPGDQYVELAKIEAGSRLRLLRTLEQDHEIWQQIRYSPDGVAWVKQKSLLAL